VFLRVIASFIMRFCISNGITLAHTVITITTTSNSCNGNPAARIQENNGRLVIRQSELKIALIFFEIIILKKIKYLVVFR
jgi:hypothetical protein